MRQIYLQYLPMGLNETSDGFNASSDVIIMDQTRVEKSTEYVLVVPRTYNETYQQLSEVLTKCIENGLIVSQKKSTLESLSNRGDLNPPNLLRKKMQSKPTKKDPGYP